MLMSVQTVFNMVNKFPEISPHCVIINSRIVNAPIETVFKAWTDPVHLANWWGPAGFTNTFLEHDFRVGGRWKFIMHGPEKGNYSNECVFTHIEEPSFIAWQRISKPLFKVAVSFEKIDGSKTQVTFRMLFDSAEECSKLKKAFTSLYLFGERLFY
jgi:uncharacterized protein YndB with AHSA1/START domain